MKPLSKEDVTDVNSLRLKLAADGVPLSSNRACERALVIDPRDTDLTYNITKKSYPTPRDMLMHNPFFVEKRKKKKKRRGKSKSPTKK